MHSEEHDESVYGPEASQVVMKGTKQLNEQVPGGLGREMEPGVDPHPHLPTPGPQEGGRERGRQRGGGQAAGGCLLG